MSNCEECCKNCCYSTPFVTLGAVVLTVVGLIGFTLSGIYGVAQQNSVEHLKNGTVVMAPVVVGMVVLTLVPLVLAIILAYCVTGYIRDILFQSAVKSCIGSLCCNGSIIVLTFIFILLWILVAIGFSGIMVYYIQAQITCNDVMSEANTSSTLCFSYVDTSFNSFEICGEDLNDICGDGLNVGVSYSISLLFTIFVITGLIVMLMIAVANYISARDHLDYRKSNNQRNDGYVMKEVR